MDYGCVVKENNKNINKKGSNMSLLAGINASNTNNDMDLMDNTIELRKYLFRLSKLTRSAIKKLIKSDEKNKKKIKKLEKELKKLQKKNK